MATADPNVNKLFARMAKTSMVLPLKLFVNAMVMSETRHAEGEKNGRMLGCITDA